MRFFGQDYKYFRNLFASNPIFLLLLPVESAKDELDNIFLIRK